MGESRVSDYKNVSYLLGYVSFFAGQLSLPLCISYALSKLILQGLNSGALLLQAYHLTGDRKESLV